MPKQKAIPPGYMTVGELAKKMNTTVRALQYYDKEGLLAPSEISEGGRRLYADRDVITLHQILSLKSLGFSLDDIKHRLVSLETPEDVAAALAEQGDAIRKQIASLSETLDTVRKLREETLRMQAVDFTKYADIIVNLQMKNEFYSFIKYFDDKTLDHLRRHFNLERGTALLDTMNRLIGEIEELQKNMASPESERGQSIAKQWWDMVTEFTGGDMSLLPGLMKMADTAHTVGGDWNIKWAGVEPFLQAALSEYFTKTGYNPFEGVEP